MKGHHKLVDGQLSFELGALPSTAREVGCSFKGHFGGAGTVSYGGSQCSASPPPPPRPFGPCGDEVSYEVMAMWGQLKHRAEQELRKEPFVAVGVLGVAALCCSCCARRYVFRRRHVRLQTDEYGGKEGRRRGRRDRRSVELLRVPRRR